MDYDKICSDALEQFKVSFLADLQDSQFNWDQLITLVLLEDSPLQEVLSSKTVQLADVCEAANKLYQSAAHLKDLENDETQSEEQREGGPDVSMEGDW